LFQPILGANAGYHDDPMLIKDAVAETFFDDEYNVPSDSSDTQNASLEAPDTADE